MQSARAREPMLTVATYLMLEQRSAIRARFEDQKKKKALNDSRYRKRARWLLCGCRSAADTGVQKQLSVSMVRRLLLLHCERVCIYEYTVRDSEESKLKLNGNVTLRSTFRLQICSLDARSLFATNINEVDQCGISMPIRTSNEFSLIHAQNSQHQF
jgi:hypothetical protein